MPIKKKVKVILIDEVKNAYEDLVSKAKQFPNSFHKTLLNSVDRNIENIKNDPLYGQPIGKSKIPKEYTRKYSITNAFWIKLSDGWRLIYSLYGEENKAEVICIVLDYLNHKDYSEKFGY